MARALVISRFAVLCLMCMSEVLAEDCAPYVDANYKLVPYQDCGILSCSGTCTYRFCMLLGNLDQTQIGCLVNNLYVIIGGSLVALLLIVGGIVACFCKCCCLACQFCASNSVI